MNLREILWSTKQTREYKIIKFASIIIGNLFAILDIYIGFLLGTEKYWLAVILIFLSIQFAIINDFAWTWVLERMGIDKVKHGKKTANRK